MAYARTGEGRGRSAINLRAVDSDWLFLVRSAAYREKMTLRDFCLRAIDLERKRVEGSPVEHVPAPEPRIFIRNPKWFTEQIKSGDPEVAA
jgi:hypothetical protein